MSHLKIMTSQRRILMADTVTEVFTILTFYLYCEIMLASYPCAQVWTSCAQWRGELRLNEHFLDTSLMSVKCSVKFLQEVRGE
jgi:hypothetical protein